MATLYITELISLGFDGRGNPVLAPKVPANAEQNVAIGGASVASAAFATTTRFVMLATDASCCLAWGAEPTAVLLAQRMAANETRFYAVNGGDKVAVIASA